MVVLIRKPYNKKLDPHIEGGKEEHYKQDSRYIVNKAIRMQM
jgi:hypothetical protein